MNRKLIAAIGLMLAFCIGIFFYAEWEKARFKASLPEAPILPPKPPPTPIQNADAGGHWHGDEWHAEPHGNHEPIGGPQNPNDEVVEEEEQPVVAEPGQPIEGHTPGDGHNVEHSSAIRTEDERIEAYIQSVIENARVTNPEFAELMDERQNIDDAMKAHELESAKLLSDIKANKFDWEALRKSEKKSRQIMERYHNWRAKFLAKYPDADPTQIGRKD